MTPMAHPLDFSQPLRDDVSKKDINRNENQHDLSKTKDGYYTVPKILD
jgi:aspartyl/glutamyl-tRNA(Asn/Gln) amidotransferase C subunit